MPADAQAEASTPTDRRRNAVNWLRVGGLGVLIVLASGAWWLGSRPPPKPVFCNLGGYIMEIDGREVWPEDQGAPGRDHCDGSKVMANAWTLGFDCKLRAPGGDVVREIEPNREDGTCGRPDDGGSLPRPDRTTRPS